MEDPYQIGVEQYVKKVIEIKVIGIVYIPPSTKVENSININHFI